MTPHSTQPWLCPGLWTFLACRSAELYPTTLGIVLPVVFLCSAGPTQQAPRQERSWFRSLFSRKVLLLNPEGYRVPAQPLTTRDGNPMMSLSMVSVLFAPANRTATSRHQVIYLFRAQLRSPDLCFACFVFLKQKQWPRLVSNLSP